MVKVVSACGNQKAKSGGMGRVFPFNYDVVLEGLLLYNIVSYRPRYLHTHQHRIVMMVCVNRVDNNIYRKKKQPHRPSGLAIIASDQGAITLPLPRRSGPRIGAS